jgi:hypothetical protein
MSMNDEYLKKQWSKIEVMLEKYEHDPSWMNETLLECMLKDYDAKTKLTWKNEN